MMTEESPAIAVEGQFQTSIFRHYQNHYLREFCSDLSISSVLNLGARPDYTDKEGSTYEAYFPRTRFITLDMEPVDHPRHVQDDLLRPVNIRGKFDLVLAMSLMEHLDRPWIAANNIAQLIRPGGYLYVAMPWFYPVHEGPAFGDHWRWTPSGNLAIFHMLESVKWSWYPSSITAVRDRRMYWNDPNACSTGFSMLLQHTPRTD